MADRLFPYSCARPSYVPDGTPARPIPVPDFSGSPRTPTRDQYERLHQRNVDEIQMHEVVARWRAAETDRANEERDRADRAEREVARLRAELNENLQLLHKLRELLSLVQLPAQERRRLIWNVQDNVQEFNNNQ